MSVGLIVVAGVFALLGLAGGFGAGFAFGDEKSDKFKWGAMAAIVGAIFGAIVFGIYVVIPALVIAVAVLLVGAVSFAIVKTISGARNETSSVMISNQHKRVAAAEMLEVKSYAFDRKREVDAEKVTYLTEVTASEAKKEAEKRAARATKKATRTAEKAARV
jgi:hypothetical protein